MSQVNPHVTLFFYDSRGSVGRPSAHRHGKGLRGGFILAALEHFLKLDLAKYLRLLRDLELLPRPMNQDYSSLFLQRFHGSVTVRPRFHISAVLRLLADPNEEWMRWYMDNGSKSIWGAIHMIENRLLIERAIRRGFGKVRRELAMSTDESATEENRLNRGIYLQPNKESLSMANGNQGNKIGDEFVDRVIEDEKREFVLEKERKKAELDAGYASEDDEDTDFLE